MCERLGKTELDESEIFDYIKSPNCKEEKSRKEFLQKLVAVYEGEKVIFSEFYLNEKLGGISAVVQNQKILFNNVDLSYRRVDICSTISTVS